MEVPARKFCFSCSQNALIKQRNAEGYRIQEEIARIVDKLMDGAQSFSSARGTIIWASSGVLAITPLVMERLSHLIAVPEAGLESFALAAALYGIPAISYRLMRITMSTVEMFSIAMNLLMGTSHSVYLALSVV
jgi:hypothetical protein